MKFRGKINDVNLFPKLSDLKFANVINPEQMYIDVYNWLSKRNEFNHIDNRNDVQKLESKGFDKKTSFRNVK